MMIIFVDTCASTSDKSNSACQSLSSQGIPYSSKVLSVKIFVKIVWAFCLTKFLLAKFLLMKFLLCMGSVQVCNRNDENFKRN